MKKKIYKFLLLGFAVIAFILVVAGGALIYWISTGPRSLDAYLSSIESAFLMPNANYTVKVESAMLYLDNWKHPLDIRVKNVSFTSKEGQVFAKFPEVSVGLEIHDLIFGRFTLKSLKVYNPVVSLYQTKDGDITFGVGTGDDRPLSLNRLLASNEGGANVGSGDLQSFIIQNASITIGNDKRGVFFTAPRTQIRFTRNSKGAKGYIDLGMQYEDKNSLVSGEFQLDRQEKNVSGRVIFSDIRPNLLSKIFILIPEKSKAVQVPLSGVIDFSVSTTGNVDYVNYEVVVGEGTISLPEILARPVTVKHVSASGSVLDNLSTILVEKLDANFNGPQIQANGVFSKVDKGIFVDFTGEGKGLQVNDLKYYWPLGLAPKTRDWVTTRITEGHVPYANIRAALQPGYEAYKFLPQDAIDADVHVEGTSVEYLEGQDKVINAGGIAYFDGRRMEVEVAKGTTGKSTMLKHATIVIPDMTPDDTRMQVDLELTASAHDISQFLATPDVNLAKKLNLDVASVKGTAEGNIKLDFLAFTAKPRPKGQNIFNGIDYSLSGNVKGFSQKNFLNQYDVDDYTGKIALDINQLALDGQVSTEGQSVQLKYTENYTANAPVKSEYVIAATLPVEFMRKHGFLDLENIAGVMGVKANVQEKGQLLQTKAEINAKEAEITIEQIGLNKPKGEALALQLDVSKDKNSGKSVVGLKAEGDKLKAEGSLSLGKEGDLLSADFSRAIFNHNDAAIAYAVIPDGFRLKAKGNILDLEAFLSAGDDDDYRLSLLPAMQLEMNLARLRMSEGRELRNVQLNADCSKVFCKSATMLAEIADKSMLKFSITSSGGQRMLKAISDNAGEALRVLDIHEDIKGGALLLEAAFDDNRPNRPLAGKLFITDYTLVKAPVLAKLLTVASLTGFLDTLSGKGISFKKLSAPFTLESDIIRLKDAKAYGSAIGLTANGNLNLKGVVLDIDGTVVPSYTLNSFFGKIPLLGEILTGGGGGGVIAANYSMKGPHKDPSVTVNPLAMLTPGFLRGVFDIFDSPKE